MLGAKYNWLGAFVGLCTCFIMFYYSVVIGWWVGIRVHLSGLGLDLRGSGGELPRPRHVVAAAAAAELGPIDILVNNAAIFAPGRISPNDGWSCVSKVVVRSSG